MDLRFDQRAVIVTGAGNGLGREHARELARRGASVVVNDVGGTTDGTGSSTRSADFVVDEIRTEGGTAIASYESVSSDAGCRRVAHQALDAFGRIDAVVHNAGILRNASFSEMSDDQWTPVVETHLFGAFFLTRAVWPHMVAAGYGRLVFTSSASGVWGRVEGANYGAAKAGIIGLCNVLALEGADHGIFANAVMPVASTRLAGAPEAADRSEAAHAHRASAYENRMAPEWVTPLVVYLASDVCDRTHRYYSAVRGRFAEVFVGVTDGWVAESPTSPSAEAVAEHLVAIEDRSKFAVPNDTFHEVQLASERVNAATHDMP
jgi:NAD(P)-dependent dehydrogenase (short-subunit alcohol dehydrogenase family)